MHIFVKCTNGQVETLDVEPADAVWNVKKKICRFEHIDPVEQRLVTGSQQLEDERTLEDYDIQNDAMIHVLLRLLGGGKKRKKKVYTTPKKNKHKRKKVKLAVLKFYKVDENGKISRLRKECSSPSCGGGVFMASHQNRHYCGKCHQTLVMQDPKLAKGK